MVGVAYGSHNFYSNHNKRTIDFFDNLCESTVSGEGYIINSSCVNVYPNPATNQVFIKTNFTDYKIEILNLKGQLLFSGENAVEVDVSGFAEGVYLARICLEDRVVTIKLFVR